MLHVNLLPGQEIRGCCGWIKDHYYHFEAVSRTGGQLASFSVGYDCAEQFLDLIGYPPLRLFDPLAPDMDSAGLDDGARGEGSRIEGRRSPRPVPLNREMSAAIHILFIAWRTFKPGSVLAQILDHIRRNPETAASASQVKSLNTIIGKDARGRTLSQIIADLRQDHPRFRAYEFPNIEAVLKANGVPSLL